MLLNSRWPFQDSNEIIPPQLQGNSLKKVITAPIYMVKAIIKNSEAYNPFNRQRGIINIRDTMNSVIGNAQAMKEETGFKIGDSAICSLNTLYSINLLIPVYRKSMINSIAIVSTIVDFDSQVKEMIFANGFRF